MANPIVTITMDNGDVMKAELYPEVAPNTVNNFISLVKKGFYDGLIFHRVINGFKKRMVLKVWLMLLMLHCGLCGKMNRGCFALGMHTF